LRLRAQLHLTRDEIGRERPAEARGEPWLVRVVLRSRRGIKTMTAGPAIIRCPRELGVAHWAFHRAFLKRTVTITRFTRKLQFRPLRPAGDADNIAPVFWASR